MAARRGRAQTIVVHEADGSHRPAVFVINAYMAPQDAIAWRFGCVPHSNGLICRSCQHSPLILL